MSAEVAVFPVMSREQAERVTEQIAFRIDSITENYEVVMSLMRDALARNAHEALGYASPGAYIADRFGKSLQTLGTALRREFVHELSDAGLSTRAIAPVFDVSHVQIAKDLKSGVNPVNTSPEPVPAEQMIRAPYVDDYVDSVQAEGMTVNPRTGEVIDDEPTVTEQTVTEKVKTTVGLDGKTYTQKPREPKPVLTGAAAEKANAIQTSKAIGQALSSLERFQYERARQTFLNETWPVGREEVQPIHRALVTPNELRKVAESLNTLANEMESHDDYR